MNRLLQRIFLAAAAACAIYAALFARSAQLLGFSLLTSKTFYGCVLVAVGFLVAAFKLKTEWKFRVALALFCLVLLELTLQATAWLGLLPGVDTKNKCPYGRVYWASEGLGNSIRNRQGWYYPAFDLKAPRRIATIGDSMVEAVEVHPTRTHSYLLQQRLKQDSPEWAVLGLGTHGTAPSYYIEVLNYAQQHFQPKEVIIYLSIGSDIAESSPALNSMPADRFLYYDVDAMRHLMLNPASAPCRERFDHDLEFSHQSLWYSLPVILNSHCMTLQSLLSVRDSFKQRQQMAAQRAVVQRLTGTGAKANVPETGFNPAPFAVAPGEEVKRAMEVIKGELDRCRDVCTRSGIRMRLVTIPAFPQAFYDTQKGRDWTMKIGDYDYLQPEREFAEFALARSLPFLALGGLMQSRKMDVAEIRSLYLANGQGHFTEKGHRFCADAEYEAFYQPKKM